MFTLFCYVWSFTEFSKLSPFERDLRFRSDSNVPPFVVPVHGKSMGCARDPLPDQLTSRRITSIKSGRSSLVGLDIPHTAAWQAFHAPHRTYETGKAFFYDLFHDGRP